MQHETYGRWNWMGIRKLSGQKVKKNKNLKTPQLTRVEYRLLKEVILLAF
jgi:hypothetical protein